MGELIDETGVRHGRLVVLNRGPNRGTSARWICQCDCGNVVMVEGTALRSTSRRPSVISCGCYRRERTTKHGAASQRTREYRIWQAMKDRCRNARDDNYARYGGRGITVCEHWTDSFLTFYEDMGPCPPERSIDRINNDGAYQCWRHDAPQNCRWATAVEQAANRSTTKRLSDEIVHAIRERYPPIRYKRNGLRRLAAEFGLSTCLLYEIATRRSRRDVV